MAKPADKMPTPAYGSFKTLTSFLDEVRDTGHVPLRIDRSLMPKLSGSAANETMATLKFLGMVDSQTSKPTGVFERYVAAGEQERKDLLAGMLKSSYAFLLDRPGFDIKRASGQQVAEIFRETGVNGSTLSRAIGFFLAAAKEAGIDVSPNVKPPVTRSTGARGKKKESRRDEETAAPNAPISAQVFDELPEDVHRFELPIPGKPSVVVLIPKSLDGEDWDMFQQMFSIYVGRWKGFKDAKGKKGEAT
jgi:hypothetical protein